MNDYEKCNASYQTQPNKARDKVQKDAKTKKPRT